MLNQIISSRLINLEQNILINQFVAAFNFAPPGVNRHIANYEQLQYEGAIAGSEFLIFANTKLYVCFDILIGWSGAADAPVGRMTFYDENNAMNLFSQNNSIAYEAIAIAIWYSANDIQVKNLYFSRIVSNVHNFMKFDGYRITLD